MVRKIGVAILLTALGIAGCTAATNQPQDISKSTQELAILDCQQAAADCVVGAKSTDDLVACRGTFENCIGAIDIPAPTEAIKCATDGVQCLADGGAIKDCRASFDSCVNALLPDMNLPQIPELPDVISQLPVISDLPQIADLPDPQAAVECAQGAAACVLEGAAVSDCRDVFEGCVKELLPALPDVSDITANLPADIAAILPADIAANLPDTEAVKGLVDSAKACATAAVDCVKSGASVLDCRDSFDQCVQALVPDVEALLPEVTIPPEIQSIIDQLKALPDPQAAVDCANSAVSCIKEGADVQACRAPFEQCIGAIVDQLPTPTVPANVEGLAQCVKAAQECVTADNAAIDACRANFETCAKALLPELPAAN